jgi:HD superfamily phosphohydrolase
MQYHDRIYGYAQINEPILSDLMQTTAVQRLQGVLQHGISALLGITCPVSRFEHSMGVMLLVRRLGAPLEEQIAALLHDVSHTAFSHVIDYVFDGHESQSYHEDMKESYVASTDLPAVLARHGYNWLDFLQEERFPLLEQPSPALCADRLDYFLRDSLDLDLSTADEVQSALSHLAVHQGRVAVDDVSTARWLGYTFIQADQASWANFREVGLYELTARAIKTGQRLGAITEADIWSTDEQIWTRLRGCDDPELMRCVTLISPHTQFVWDEDNPTFRISTKLRTIDPDVLVDGRLRPLSAIDGEFARHRSDYLRSKGGKWPMRVIAHTGEDGAVVAT